MAYCFITESGSAYEVSNGRITRYGDGDIVDRNTGEVFKSDLVNESITWIVPPAVGSSAKFQLRDKSHRLGGSACTTTKVALVAPIVQVNYITE